MNRIIKISVICLALIAIFTLSVNAQEADEIRDVSGAENLIGNLPYEVQYSLKGIGVDTTDFSSISDLSFADLVSQLGESAIKEVKGVVPSLCTVLAVLLLYSIFNGVFDSVSNPSLSSVLSLVSALCLGCVFLIPVTDLIKTADKTIQLSADFMLAFIPVTTAVLISAGNTITGSGYCAMMVVAAEAVGQLFSKIVSPLLNCFLALGISTSLVPEIRISGFLNFFSKTVKWIMSFAFTLFSALLGLKSLYSSSVDNVSSRAVKYTMSSFIPVVGGALSEAYKTVHGSIGVLKSGVGVFAIIAIVMVFLPLIIKLCAWLFTINICKCFCETASLQSPDVLLSSISTVLSLLMSVVFCVVALFVITTALIITIGGGQ